MKSCLPLLLLLTSGCLLSSQDAREDNALLPDPTVDMAKPSDMTQDMVADTPRDTAPDIQMDMAQDTTPDTPVDMPPSSPCMPACEAPNGCKVKEDGTGVCVAAPKTCEEARVAETLFGSGAGNDDFANLYIGNDPNREWSARCHRNTSNAPYLEYLATPFGEGQSRANNTAIDYASGIQTVYEAYRIDPLTLIIDGSDTTYATTTPIEPAVTLTPPHKPSEIFTHVAPGLVRGCGAGSSAPGQPNEDLYPATTQLDIGETGLRIKSAFKEHGLCTGTTGKVNIAFSPDLTHVTLEITPNSTQHGCTGLATTALANKFEAVCGNIVSRTSNMPTPADFQVQLEHLGP